MTERQFGKGFVQPTAYESISSGEDSCEGCNCFLKDVSCELCVHSAYQCNGSCRCCAQYRWDKVKECMMKSAIEMGFDMARKHMEVGFKPVPREPFVDAPSTSTARQHEIQGKVSGTANLYGTSTNSKDCSECKCQMGKNVCEWCIAISFKCPGTCDCCKEHREVKLKESEDEITIIKEIGVPTTPKDAYIKILGVTEFPCCTCKPDELPCIYCFKANFKCRHSCMRCMLFRMRRERLEVTTRIYQGNK